MTLPNKRSRTRYNVEQMLAKHREALTTLIYESPSSRDECKIIEGLLNEVLRQITVAYPVRADEKFVIEFTRRRQEAMSLPDFDPTDWDRAAKVLGIPEFKQETA
jgi:hypothetical protein